MLTFDLATLQKPQRLARVAQKAEQLVNAMEAAGKPLASVTLTRADYYSVLEVVNKGREGELYEAIRCGEIPVRPA